jgi:two-component system cell cycle sensor histidine kinase/response regulator CckA
MNATQAPPAPAARNTDEVMILAVDDKLANLIALERVLAGIPARIVRAMSGEEALAASLRHRFALAILDVQMPGMDGYELAELMLGDPATASTPIIFVTAAYSDEAHQFKGYSAGAVDYLVKPYDPAILLSKVRVFIDLARHKSDLEGLIAERTKALSASEERYRTLYETMAQGVLLQDGNGRVIDANPAATRILGTSREALLARQPDDPTWDFASASGGALPGHDFPSLRALRTGQPVLDELLGITHATRGDRVWLSVSSIPRRLAGALESEHVYTTFSDVTARREAEQRLENSERALRAVFEGTQDGIAVVDAETLELRLANHAVLRMLEIPSPLRAGISLGDFLSSDQVAQLTVERIEGERRHDGPIELVVTRADGSAIVTDARATSIALDGSECTLLVLRDMTQRRRQERESRRLQTELFQAQKMESIGVLAGGVAHDFNNLLSVIGCYVELTLENDTTSAEAREDLGEVKLAAERSAELTRKLLAFGRKQPMKREPLDLNVVVRSTEKLLRRIIGEDIELVVELDDHLGFVMADVGHVEQIIMNLAANARDAMKSGGRLLVQTENVDVSEELATSQAGLSVGAHVVLRVRDDGCGMDEATAQRVFEPFFTTKPEGVGTGLGLSTVYGIVKQSDGHLGLTSELGVGTTFEIYLPRLAGAALGTSALREVEGARVGGTETVLVVEDADPVRSLSVRILDSAGYRVLTAVDGLDALRVLESFRDRVDLVLTDVVMPRMGGDELAAKLAQSHPDIEVLFMSGYVGRGFARGDGEAPSRNFIAKPFTVNDMLQTVRALLDGRSSLLPKLPRS